MAHKKTNKTDEKVDPTDEVLTLVGAFRCYLCSRTIPSVEALSDHLYKEHKSMTLAEYRKLFPARLRPFDISQRVMSGEQLYQAVCYKAAHGTWPPWYDGSRAIRLAEADPFISRAFATLILRHYMERLGPTMLFAQLAAEHYYDPTEAASGTPESVIKMHQASDDIYKAILALTRLFKLLGVGVDTVPQGYQTTYVKAEQIEAVEEDHSKPTEEQLQHEETARIDQLTSQLQSLVAELQRSAVPPSQVEEDGE